MKREVRRVVQPYKLVIPGLVIVFITLLNHGYLMNVVISGLHHYDNYAESDDVSSDDAMLESENYTQRLPQCIIIGVRKCGTRALLEFLDLHPLIVTSEDEMHFFSSDYNYRLGLEWYRTKMPFSHPNQITVEKTPKYFISKRSPRRVYQMNKSVKLLAIFRHPTIRVVSDYAQICANKQARNERLRSFESLVLSPATGLINPRYKAVQISLYYQWVANWLKYFPRDQLHIVDGDQLIKSPLTELAKIETFLDLPHLIRNESFYFNKTRGFYCMRKTNKSPDRCLGIHKGRKHPKLNETVLNKLSRFFRPHNERLYKLIGRRFKWR